MGRRNRKNIGETITSSSEYEFSYWKNCIQLIISWWGKEVPSRKNWSIIWNLKGNSIYWEEITNISSLQSLQKLIFSKSSYEDNDAYTTCNIMANMITILHSNEAPNQSNSIMYAEEWSKSSFHIINNIFSNSELDPRLTTSSNKTFLNNEFIIVFSWIMWPTKQISKGVKTS